MKKQKTKYIKVSVSDRLPRYGWAVVEKKNKEISTVLFNPNTNEKTFRLNYDFFLEEVPDYEEEMMDMLKECFESFRYIHANASFVFHESNTEDHIEHLPYRMQELEKLLTKLKQ